MQMTRRGLLATVWATGLAACAGAPALSGATGARGPDATAMAAMIRDRKASSAELVEAAIGRSTALQPKLNFLVMDLYEPARARAREALSGPFAGVPTLVKDTTAFKGTPTRIGSRATANARQQPLLRVKQAKSRDVARLEEELSDLLTAAVEIRIKKRTRRGEQGELTIAFGSLDELNGLIEKLRPPSRT